MTILENHQSLADYISACKEKKQSIGFAPTMGALHGGHISLYEKARPENNIVIASIFVNPTQFNNPEDFKKYPNTLDRDIELLEKSNLVDALYLPTEKDIYPNGTESSYYELGNIETVMEGAFRPGHFQGVATVVEKLFRQVQPDNAYFGEKDYQQIAVINKLVKLKKLPIKIHSVPTIREKNGLAMSSRNLRLSDTGKEQATIIYNTLSQLKEWKKQLSVAEIEHRVKEIFLTNKDITLEYFIIADENTLQPIINLQNSNPRAFIAAHIEGVRLIDNMTM